MKCELRSDEQTVLYEVQEMIGNEKVTDRNIESTQILLIRKSLCAEHDENWAK